MASVLGNYTLNYERLESEKILKKQKRLIRAKKLVYSKQLRVPRFRLFKRLQRLEGKLDKPYLYDSSLLSRIEALEAEVGKKK